MTHKPTLLDAASDLRRCLHASMGKNGFENVNYVVFLSNAEKIIKNNNADYKVTSLLKRAKDKTLEADKRRENLLMAASLLMNTS